MRIIPITRYSKKDILKTKHQREQNIQEGKCDIVEFKTQNSKKDSDVKSKLLAAAEKIARDYDSSLKLVLSEFMNNAKDKNGKVDFGIIGDALEIIDNSVNSCHPGYIINLLKHFYSKDNDKRQEILDTMLELNKSDFMIGENDDGFEELMELCFDKNNCYSVERAEIMLNQVDILENCIAAKFDEEKDSAKTYDLYCAIAKDTICTHFAQDSIEELFNLRLE